MKPSTSHMPGDVFRFKRFTVRQDRCAMKVTTEGCLFGAWLASHATEPRRILDIGAGTGLIMLMTAQAFPCPVDGVELDPAAASQARENLADSPWADRCTIYSDDVRSFRNTSRYDLVVSNPPFHTASLRSGDERVNMARHDDSLTLDQLAAAAQRLSTDDGSLAVWLPCRKAAELEGISKNRGWNVSRRLHVSRKNGEPPFRTLTELKRASSGRIEELDVFIRDSDGSYGDAFREWLTPYYLQL